MSTSKRVEVLAAAGAPWVRIAREMGIDVAELRRRHGDELVHGPERIEAELARVVHEKALAGHVWAIKLAMKQWGNR